MMLGRVDELDGHFIATKFVALMIPTDSVYVTPSPPTKSRASVSSSLGPLKVKKDWRSVGLGYARVWLPIWAVAIPLAELISSGTVHAVTIVTSALAIAGALLAYRAGRLPEKEKARIRLLGTVTGLRICPTKLLDTTRAVKRDSLGDLMEKGGIPVTPEGILAVIDDIPMPAMALVYGYCCYAGDDEEWRDCADLIYARHEQSEV